MDDLSHTSLTDSESDSSFYEMDTTVDTSFSFEIDALQDLEQRLSDNVSRLTLKWEQSKDGCHSKIMVGINTYLPLSIGRSCYSLEITASNETDTSSKSSARTLLFRLVSKIVSLSPCIRQLDLEGFGSSSNGDETNFEKALDIEDVFEAFAQEELSPWRNGRLMVLRTWNCDMNSNRGNESFDMAKGKYPRGLEEVYVHNPKGSVLSSSIFKILSRSEKLCRFYVFDGFDKSDNSNSDGNFSDPHNNYPQHQFNGSRLTQSSIDALCEVLSSTNRLREMNQLPFRELLQLPEEKFTKILEATTQTRNTIGSTTNLRFPIQPPATVSRLTILASRSDSLRFFLQWKRSLEILRNPLTRHLSPLVLRKCQKRKSMHQYIPYSKNDLIFAMLQDSLEGILKLQKARERKVL